MYFSAKKTGKKMLKLLFVIEMVQKIWKNFRENHFLMKSSIEIKVAEPRQALVSLKKESNRNI
jgi:hypothetical protein